MSRLIPIALSAAVILSGCVTTSPQSSMMAERHRCMEKAMASAGAPKPDETKEMKMAAMMEKCPMMEKHAKADSVAAPSAEHQHSPDATAPAAH
jgi:hypothetical protein